jgi:hypothetical protein
MTFDNTCTWTISKNCPLNADIYPPGRRFLGTISGLGVVAREIFLLLAPIYQTTQGHILRMQYLHSRSHYIKSCVYYDVHKRRLFVRVLSHMNPVHKIPPYFFDTSKPELNTFPGCLFSPLRYKKRERNLLRNPAVISGGVSLVFKIPIIPLIIHLVRA